MGNVFFGEKRNSSTEWETDSNPTNAHGASATIRRISMAGGEPGTNAGEKEPKSPP